MKTSKKKPRKAANATATATATVGCVPLPTKI